MIRRILKVFGIAFVVGLAAIAALLGEAHWQVRQVEPALPTGQDIAAALDNGPDPVSISYINTATQVSPLGAIGHVGVLIEWDSGKRLLIDTGMPAEQAVAFGKPMEQILDAEPAQTFGAIDEQIGPAVNTIGAIAFTHLHSDHTDGLTGICAAQHSPATVFQTSLQRDEQNYGTVGGEKTIATSACGRVVLGAETVKLVPGYSGIVAIAAGGHTAGSTIYATRRNGKIWVFAGDITNDMHSLHNNIPKPWLYSTFIVPEHTRRQEQLRLWLEALDQQADFVVLVAHDIDAWKRSEIPAWRKGVQRKT
jgi:glyoxylase-like metal-dependent hydrolase (beta-lactamase superfamily II)